MAILWMLPSLANAQQGAAPEDNWFDHVLTQANDHFAALEELRIRPDRTPQKVSGVYDAARMLLDEADRKLQKDRQEIDLKLQQLNRANNAAARSLKAEQAENVARRCRIALLRGEFAYAAARALPEGEQTRATYLDSAISTFKSLRLDYLGMPLSSLGYIGQAKSLRAAGQAEQARQALRPLLLAKPSQRNGVPEELYLLATLEDLDAQFEIEPAAATDRATTLRNSPAFRKKPIWQGRLDWFLARAKAAEAFRQSRLATKSKETDNLIRQAADLLRKPSVLKAAPPYDRLKLLSELDELGNGDLMNRQELLTWADMLAAIENTRAANYYQRALAIQGTKLSAKRLYAYAALLWKQDDLIGTADTCDILLKQSDRGETYFPKAVRLRAAALSRQWSRTPPASRTDKLQSRLLASVEVIVSGEYPEAVRRDALRQLVAVFSRKAGLAACVKMLVTHGTLVKDDPYLMYARAAGRWETFLAATANNQPLQDLSIVLADVQTAADSAKRARNDSLIARSALLLAKIHFSPSKKDSRAALRILRDASDAIETDKTISAQARLLRAGLLMDLGLPDLAQKELAGSRNTDSSASLQLLLQLADSLADRFDGTAGRRETIVDLCNQALAASLQDAARYNTTAERSARIMLRVGAHAYAKGILTKLLDSPAVRSDSQTTLDCTLMMAEALTQAGQLDRCRSLLTKLIKQHPNSAESHLSLGRLKMHLRQPAAAVASFRKTRELAAPGTVLWCKATLALAEGLQKQGHEDAAEDILRVAAALYPRFGSGELLARMKDTRNKLKAAE